MNIIIAVVFIMLFILCLVFMSATLFKFFMNKIVSPIKEWALEEIPSTAPAKNIFFSNKQQNSIQHYRLALKDLSDFSDGKSVEFDGWLFYSARFSYVNMFDSFYEKIEFFKTNSGKYILYWPSTGQFLIRNNAKDFINCASGYGLKQKHLKKMYTICPELDTESKKSTIYL